MKISFDKAENVVGKKLRMKYISGTYGNFWALDIAFYTALVYGYVLMVSHHCLVYVEKLLLGAYDVFIAIIFTAWAISVIQFVLVEPDSRNFKHHTTIHSVTH